MSRSNRGLTIAEVLVASSCFLLVMTIGLGAVEVVKRAGDHLKNRSEPRQQLRALVGHLQTQVRAAAFVFPATGPVNFGGGHSHTFSGAPPIWPEQPPAESLLWASAESAEIQPTYRVQGLYLKEDTSANRAFDGAHVAILAEVSQTPTTVPGNPAGIVLGSLESGTSAFRRFALAAPSDGLRVWLTPSADGAIFEFVLGHKNQTGAITRQLYRTQFTMRNNR